LLFESSHQAHDDVRLELVAIAVADGLTQAAHGGFGTLRHRSVRRVDHRERRREQAALPASRVLCPQLPGIERLRDELGYVDRHSPLGPQPDCVGFWRSREEQLEPALGQELGHLLHILGRQRCALGQATGPLPDLLVEEGRQLQVIADENGAP
jgi:hypothetical protein